MLYIYGITRADRSRPAVEGLGDPPTTVRLVESASLAAAVSDLPEGYVVHDDDARAHLKVLIELLRDGPVLPIRMGTVAPNEDVLRSDVLDASTPELTERLDALDGFVELHVDADDEEADSIGALAAASGIRPGRPMGLDGRIQLGGQIADLLVDYRQQVGAEIVERLRPLAVQDVPRTAVRSAEDPMLRWAFLVARGDLPKFDAAVADIRRDHPELAIRYAGPLPPSHFVDWQPDADARTYSDSFQATGAWGWQS
jgi:Gas vesicle synthesis protein GvpL/GvpF